MATKTNRVLPVGSSYLERLVKNGFYDSCGLLVAGLGLIALGSLLWFIGARLTVDWLEALFLAPGQKSEWAGASWAIPVGMSAIEIFLLKKITEDIRIFFGWGSVLALDTGTNFGGSLVFFLGLILNRKVVLPLEWVIAICFVASIALAYGPEKLVRAGLHTIRVAFYGLVLSLEASKSSTDSTEKGNTPPLVYNLEEARAARQGRERESGKH